MHYQSVQGSGANHYVFAPEIFAAGNDNRVRCSWPALCEQLTQQWSEITPRELEGTQHSRYQIAKLIQRKYGIPAAMAENYLRNFERTLPLLGVA